MDNEAERRVIRTRTMGKIDYPFDEFVEDFRVFTQGLEAEREAYLQADGELPEPKAFEMMVIEIAGFMRARKSPEFARKRATAFGLMIDCLNQNFSALDTNDYVVDGSRETGGLVGEHVLKAVHHLYTAKPLSELEHNPTPTDIKELADRFRRDYG